MRRLLRSWFLFAAVWIPAHALAAAFVERRIAFTQAAFWSGAFVPLVQAVAVESLARPLLGESVRGLFAAVGRSGSLRLVWGATAIAVGLVLSGLGAAPGGFFREHEIAPIATVLFLLLGGALLAERGWRLRSGSLAASGALALLVAAALAAPGVSSSLMRRLGPPATVRFLAIAAATAVAAALLLRIARLAPTAPQPAALFYECAAGASVGAGVARIIPATLGIPLDPLRAVPVQILLLVAAAAAVSGALAAGRARDAE